jgi:hypothetical protein
MRTQLFFQMRSGGEMKMIRVGIVIAVGTFFCLGATAQAQTGAQAGAQSSSQASVEAGKTQAQASGNASAAGSASAQNGQANGSLASGTAFNAALSSPVDSKKCKPGDAVTAHNTEPVKSEGKTVIPKGSKLVGHVTQASARAKGESESSLGIVFDKAILKNGQEMPLNAGIQAIASAQSAASAAAGGLNAAGQLTSNSQGVFGLNGLNLSTAASNATQGSVITSAGKNVHLDSGTRMLLVSQAQAGDQGESKQPSASKPEPKSAPKSEPNKPNNQ